MTDGQGHTWVKCEAHPMATDTDCDYCKQQVAGMADALQELQSKAAGLNRKLAGMHEGVPYIETATAVPQLAVEVLVNMIFQDPRANLAFQLNFHNRLVEQMEMVHSAAVKNVITSNGGARVMSPEQRRLLRKMKGGG